MRIVRRLYPQDVFEAATPVSLGEEDDEATTVVINIIGYEGESGFVASSLVLDIEDAQDLAKRINNALDLHAASVVEGDSGPGPRYTWTVTVGDRVIETSRNVKYTDRDEAVRAALIGAVPHAWLSPRIRLFVDDQPGDVLTVAEALAVRTGA